MLHPILGIDLGEDRHVFVLVRAVRAPYIEGNVRILRVKRTRFLVVRRIRDKSQNRSSVRILSERIITLIVTRKAVAVFAVFHIVRVKRHGWRSLAENIPASSINVYKRDTQGVIVMRVEEGSQVVSVERIDPVDGENAE